jgi:hypothetical protein
VEGAPRWKGTTAEAVAAPLPTGCTITSVAVIAVPFVMPSTRTVAPFVTAPAEVERAPFVYFVDAALVTVTFWPAAVDTVKLDLDTLATVPTVPPAAGPDRAFDPALANRAAPTAAGLLFAVLAVAELPLEVALTTP